MVTVFCYFFSPKGEDFFFIIFSQVHLGGEQLGKNSRETRTRKASIEY
jgi:hypothetical protein